MNSPSKGKLFSSLTLLSLIMLGVSAGVGTGAKAADPVALPSYQADLRQTTVSGLSSGSYMAGQFAVAYSATVKGVALVAGGPYYCAGTVGVPPYIPYLATAMGTCMNPAHSNVAPPVAERSWQAMKKFAQAGQIDSPDNISRQKVYVFSGVKDMTVTRAVVDQTYKFYQLAGVPENNLRYVIKYDAGHAFITNLTDDLACASTASPYINNCDYDQAQDILEFFYPGLRPPAATLSGKMIHFNQRSFVRSAYSSMSNSAYAYVPRECERERCRVHVTFHGCNQGVALIGDHYYNKAGFNQVADTNRIIMLYPQADPSPVYPYNPRGCWDFWGYTSVNPFLPDFYLKSGVQSAAVKAMLDRLGAPRDDTHMARR